MADSKSPARSLTKVAPAPVAKLAKRYRGLAERLSEVAEEDLRIVEGMNRFKDLPTDFEPKEYKRVLTILESGSDAEVRKLGFPTREDLRLALYARMPRADVPYAIQAAHERVGMRIRKDPDKARTTVNLAMIQIPAPKPLTADDRVIIVQPETK